MAVNQSTLVGFGLFVPGLAAFAFAVLAEDKKPDLSGTPNLSYDSATDKTTCDYPKDLTIAYGIVAVILLFISAVMCVVAFYFPYEGKRISPFVYTRSRLLVGFTFVSLAVFCVAEALLMWAIAVESNHRIHNVHSGQIGDCPTAKSGIFGGAGFLALDSTLFFLIVLMLITNERRDYLMDEEADEQSSYLEVVSTPPLIAGQEGDKV